MMTHHKFQADTIPPTSGKLPILAAIYIISVALPFGFNIGPLYMTPLRLLLLTAFLPLFLQLLAGRFGKILPTDILYILFIAYSTIAIAQTSPEMVIANTGATTIEFLGGYLVARAAIRSKSDFIAMCKWLGVFTAATIPFALLEAKTDNPILITTLGKLPGIKGLTNVNYETRMGLYRAQVFLAHPIHYGLFCSTIVSLVVVCLKGNISDTWRYTLGTCVIFGVFLSLSSGALLPMIIQIFLITWAWTFRKSNAKWWILLSIAAAGWIAIDIVSNRSPLMVFLHYLTFSSHTAYWRVLIFEWGMVNVKSSPFVGIGFHDWVRPHFMHTSSVDNFWLLNAMRYGIPAALLIMAGYGIGVFQVIKRKFGDDTLLSQIRLGWVFTFLGMALTLCTVHVWTSVFSYTFFLYGAGMWLIHAKPETATPQADMKPPEAADTRGPLKYTRFTNKTHRRA